MRASLWDGVRGAKQHTAPPREYPPLKRLISQRDVRMDSAPHIVERSRSRSLDLTHRLTHTCVAAARPIQITADKMPDWPDAGGRTRTVKSPFIEDESRDNERMRNEIRMKPDGRPPCRKIHSSVCGAVCAMYALRRIV